MKWKWISCVALVLAGVMTLGTASVQTHRPPPAPIVEVFSTGLDNPRGLQFGPDGKLYVAEAGSGGTESTADLAGRRGRRFHRPSPVRARPGGGCSYGSATFPKSIIEVDTRTGRYRQIADLGAFRRSHPASLPDDDLERKASISASKPHSANSTSSTSTPANSSKYASTAEFLSSPTSPRSSVTSHPPPSLRPVRAADSRIPRRGAWCACIRTAGGKRCSPG